MATTAAATRPTNDELQRQGEAVRAWNKNRDYLAPEHAASEALCTAVDRCLADVNNASYSITAMQVIELAQLRHPDVDLRESVPTLARDFRMLFLGTLEALKRKRVLLDQITQRTARIARSREVAEQHYQNLLATKIDEKLARLHAPPFDEKPLLAECDALRTELKALNVFIGFGNFDRLPEQLKANPELGEKIKKPWEA